VWQNGDQEGRSSRRHAHGRGAGQIEKPPNPWQGGGFEVGQNWIRTKLAVMLIASPPFFWNP